MVPHPCPLDGSRPLLSPFKLGTYILPHGALELPEVKLKNSKKSLFLLSRIESLDSEVLVI